MNIIDTFQDLIILKSEFDSNPPSLYKLWQKYIEKYGDNLKQKLIDDSKGYNFEVDIKPIIIACLTTHFDKMELAHNSFLTITHEANKSFHDLFHCKENISIYFYCGLCNGAGWATTLQNNDIVLLGVEKIVELGWYDQKNMMALLYHELGHIAHDILRNNAEPNLKSSSNQSIWQIYREGFAMLCEQKL